MRGINMSRGRGLSCTPHAQEGSTSHAVWVPVNKARIGHSPKLVFATTELHTAFLRTGSGPQQPGTGMGTFWGAWGQGSL